MMNKGIDTFKAGVFVVVALAFFIISILYLGKEKEIFSSQVNYYVNFKDVKGLSEGSPVRLGGVIVGRVLKIEFANDTTIMVTLSIGQRHIDRIRTDTKVTLQTLGLLGDRFASLTIGKDETRVPAGSFLPTAIESDFGEIVGQASKIVDNSIAITEDIKSLTSEIKGQASLDLKHSITEFRELVATISSIAKEIKNGKGLANAIIYNPQGGQLVGSLADFSEKISKSADKIEKLIGEINNPNNASLAQTIASLNETAKNLKEASNMLKSGSGTAGALLVDSKLYDSLVEITDGAQRSFILKQAIRSSLKE